jgi:hypothetical protein
MISRGVPLALLLIGLAPAATACSSVAKGLGSDSDQAPTEATADPRTWTTVYTRYFGADSLGHCGNAGCHDETRGSFVCGGTKDSCYDGLVAAGLITPDMPMLSPLADPARSPLAWFGNGASAVRPVSGETYGQAAATGVGNMPKDTPLPNMDAAEAVMAWVDSGAKND